MSEFLSTANKIVEKQEASYLGDLFDKARREKQRAEVCGCRSCVNGYNRAQEAFNQEVQRITKEVEADHEELILADWAITTHLLTDSEEDEENYDYE